MNYQTELITLGSARRLMMRRSSLYGIGTFATHELDAMT
jgi:hypothetical protein